jgi:hypothetical protein
VIFDRYGVVTGKMDGDKADNLHERFYLVSLAVCEPSIAAQTIFNLNVYIYWIRESETRLVLILDSATSR